MKLCPRKVALMICQWRRIISGRQYRGTFVHGTVLGHFFYYKYRYRRYFLKKEPKYRYRGTFFKNAAVLSIILKQSSSVFNSAVERVFSFGKDILKLKRAVNLISKCFCF